MQKKSKSRNSKDDYEKALASDDPTKVSKKDLQNFAKDAVKKFKSLQ